MNSYESDLFGKLHAKFISNCAFTENYLLSLMLTAQNISKSFGLVPVFSKINLSINEKDRIGIIGPNGAGKSTLLKIIAGLEHSDEGTVAPRRGLTTGYVPQHKDFAAGATVREVLSSSLSSTPLRDELGRVESLIGRASFPDADAPAHALSGGWKKRLAICEAVVKNPDLLLLDEPTNHLDLDGIEWLEEFLGASPMAVCVISHDRYFLESVATQIFEVNRVYPSGVFAVAGGYGKFMEHKALFLDGQNATMASMANKLRAETAWLQRGAQARATKQQARIKSAGHLKSELESSQQRTRRLDVEFKFVSSERKSKRLIDVKGLSKSFGDHILFRDLSFTLGPGMRLGLLGPNGSGKSTLLKTIQNQIPADTGSVEHADALRIVYYDQQREQLPRGMTLRRALAPDSDSVLFQGRSLHVASYSKSFGFRPEQLDTAVERLSGGEGARLLMARMLLQPADVLILDEPTNDLDIDTLEVLEESLRSFPGAVILVTHDRYLMDRVCNGMLGIMGEGSAVFFADYAQYVIDLTARRAETSGKRGNKKNEPATKQDQKSHKKLSYLEQREWDGMEKTIIAAELALAAANALADSPAISSNSMKLQEACQAAQAAQSHVEKLYGRWTELESRLGPDPK